MSTPSAANEAIFTFKLNDYPRVFTRHCRFEDLGSRLQVELAKVRMLYAKKKKPCTFTVDIEHLCLQDTRQEDGAASEFYSVPESAVHRLCPTADFSSGSHYLWLRFAAERTPPPDVGCIGDVWVNTLQFSPERKKIYVRERTKWVSWTPRGTYYRHPFATNLVLAFGIWNLGWYPPADVAILLPALWRSAREMAGGYDELSAGDIVDILYGATAQNTSTQSFGPTTSVAHDCRQQSRSMKQWHATRVRVALRKISVSVLLISQHETEGAPSVPKADAETKAAVATCRSVVWEQEGTIILYLENSLFKIRLSKILEVTTKLDFARDGKIIAIVDNLPVYRFGPRYESAALVVFILSLTIGFDRTSVHATAHLTTLINISSRSQLDAPAIEQQAKHDLSALWSPDLASVTRTHLIGAPSALLVARWYALPEIRKRAFFELVRNEDPLAEIGRSPYPRQWHLSDHELMQLIRAREALKGLWRAFVATSHSIFTETCLFTAAGSKGQACRKDAWETAVRSIDRALERDPISALASLAAMNWEGGGMCMECARTVSRVCEAKRQEWWSLLDEWIAPAEVDRSRDITAVAPPKEDEVQEILCVDSEEEETISEVETCVEDAVQSAHDAGVVTHAKTQGWERSTSPEGNGESPYPTAAQLHQRSFERAVVANDSRCILDVRVPQNAPPRPRPFIGSLSPATWDHGVPGYASSDDSDCD